MCAFIIAGGILDYIYIYIYNYIQVYISAKSEQCLYPSSRTRDKRSCSAKRVVVSFCNLCLSV